MKNFTKNYFITRDGKILKQYENQKRAKYYKEKTEIDGVFYKELVIQSNKQGYNVIKVDGKWYRIGRLLLTSFDREPFENEECDHVNRIRTDDRLENLRWVTKSENSLNRDNVAIKNNLGSFLKEGEIFKIIKDDVELDCGKAKYLMDKYKISKFHFYDLVKTGKVSKKFLFSLVKCND